MMFKTTRRTLVALAASAIFTCAMPSRGQTTYYVNGSCGDDSWTGLSPVCEAPDGPKKTIQAGINAADHFDAVEVADGIYRGAGNKNLEFFTKEMSIRSAGGPSKCIVDCENDGFGFTFCTLPDDRPVTIEGFTIRNGRYYWTSGICIANADVTIQDCIIEHCTATAQNGNPARAGGVLISGTSSVRILRTIIQQNQSGTGERDPGVGGGINVDGESTVRIEDSQVLDNEAYPTPWGNGGGINVARGELIMSRCVVARNVLRRGEVAQNMGGGIFIGGFVSQCTISESRIIDNRIDVTGGTDGTRGGGIAVGARIVVDRCEITGNAAGSGGGLSLSVNPNDPPSEIRDSLLADNLARLDGGGLAFADSGSLRLDHVRVQGNRAQRDGGGIHCYVGGDIILSATTVSDNEAGGSGGGAYSIYGGIQADRAAFLDNRAQGDGGGVWWWGMPPRITNSLVAGNVAGGRGGGLNVWGGVYQNLTVTRNTAVAGGGAFELHPQSVSTRPSRNLICWGNGPMEIMDPSGTFRVLHSNVAGGWPGVGNLNADPQFVDPAAGDYRLRAGSLCIDAGDTEFVFGELDLAGSPRRVDDPGMPDAGIGSGPIVDMGAYEFQGTSTGFIAVHPRPGIAGQNNQLQAAGATPGNLVYFVYGFNSGSTNVTGCPGLTIDIANPRLAAQTTADGSGYASKTINIPGAASGQSIILQAVDRAGCAVSNAVGYRFP